MFLAFSPFKSGIPFEPVRLVGDSILLFAGCADACRRPIPRLDSKRWFTFLGLAVCILVLPVLVLRQFFLRPFSIPSAGMQPTLMGGAKTPDGIQKPGDRVMVEKLTYYLHKPQRGDIVAVKTVGLPQVDQKQIYLKRLVGLPGERVSIHSPFLYVNGNKVTSPKIFERIAMATDGYSGYVGAGRLTSDHDEILLGNDEYLVLGDNSQNSLDGRYFGPIKEKNIIGKVAWIYAPPERRGWP